jgi:hypothetical protein
MTKLAIEEAIDRDGICAVFSSTNLDEKEEEPVSCFEWDSDEDSNEDEDEDEGESKFILDQYVLREVKYVNDEYRRLR